MSVTIVTVRSQVDLGVFDVTFGADADVAAVVPHGIGSGLSKTTGAVPEVVEVTAAPTPGTAAAQRLADVRNAGYDATNVNLSKTNAGGSSPVTVRVVVARRALQFSARNTALLSAVAGAASSDS